MHYITTTDLSAIIRQPVLNEISENTPANLTEASASAKSEVEDYLNTLYDTVQIFNRTGDDRHRSVVRVMCELTLYYAHKRINPHNIPELRRQGYQDAINWLKDVRDGRMAPRGLPRIENEDGILQSTNRFNTDQRLTEGW
ncbi:MAG TPA: phage protein Gp36 family protein [Chitinophagales bacterium]|nr:phage protein Gp36 family protein [Chitinophagales bacterium]